jgi:predicted nucleic acid-binding protein
VRAVTRFVVDTGVVLLLASEELELPAEHELLAPTLLRSQALSAVYEAVRRGDLSMEEGRERLAYVNRMKIRLLGDAVLRRVAWKLAEQLDLDSTYDAEYLALTQLQADFFVTLDEDLARRAAEVVPTATIDDLRAA